VTVAGIMIRRLASGNAAQASAGASAEQALVGCRCKVPARLVRQ